MTQDRRITDKLPNEELVFTDEQLIAAAQEHLRAERTEGCLLAIPDTVPALHVAVGPAAWIAKHSASQSQAVPSELASVLRKYADHDNWLQDEHGKCRLWMEPDSSTPMEYHGWTLAEQALANVESLSHSAATGKEGFAGAAEWLRNNAYLYPNLASICEAMVEAGQGTATGKVPEGWKFVPVELTDEMRKAWTTNGNDTSDYVEGCKIAYRAMLAASPAAPLAGKAEPDRIEEAAKAIYKLLPACQGRDATTNPWQEGGNSIKQDEARSYARAAFSAFAPLAAAVHAEEASAAPFPERNPNVPAEQQGLFRKFDVHRVDGSDQPGGKHHGCRYYVLDLTHDQHAPAAMRAYAASCRATHPQLAADIEAEFGTPAEPAPIQASADPVVVNGQIARRESIAANHDAMIILTQSYPRDAVIRVVDAHTERNVAAALAAARLSKPTAQGTASEAVTTEPEYLALRLKRVARAAGVPIFDKWSNEQIVECAVTILGEIARKLEVGQSPAQVTGEPASIDTPEFRALLDEFAYRASERRAMGGDFGSAENEEVAEASLIAHINRHIAAQATAGRDAKAVHEAGFSAGWNEALVTARADVRELQNNLETFGPNAEETARVALDGALDAIDELKSHAAEQSSGGAK